MLPTWWRPTKKLIQILVELGHSSSGQGCQIFIVTTYQNGSKYTKMTTKVPNGYKRYNLTKKHWHKKFQHLPIQDLPKFTQIGIFGLKIYHLAALLRVALKLENSIRRVCFSRATREVAAGVRKEELRILLVRLDCRKTGCQIFLGTKYQHGEKIDQITKSTKWPQNITNCRKYVDQMAIK
jgi:hypothetical protein